MSDEAKPPQNEPADEAKPPQKKPASGAKRPRKPAADSARKPRASRAKPKASDEPAASAAAAKAAPAADASDAAATPGDAPTQVTPPDDAPTQIAADHGDAAASVPADAPTAVIAGDAAATEVAAGGGGADTPPPPSFAPLPRTLTPSGGGDRNTTLWVVVAVAAVAILALVLVWAFALRGGGDEFVGSWAPVSGEGGGLVISAPDDNFQVEMYDPDLQLTGSYPATRDGDDLTFRFTDTQTQLGMVEARLTYDEDRDILTMRLSAMGQEGSPLEFARVDALVAASPSPTPTPSPTTTPSPSPTSSPTGSPSPSPSPTGTDTAQYDQQVVDAIVQIQVGVLNWSAENGGYPAADEVTADGGVGEYLTTWPTNPFSGQPMVAGDQPGDYAYEQLDGGQGYKLTGYLANGLTFTVP